LLAALRETGAAVLIAPPGAGKTTAVAPALLAELWCEGSVILLSPRRVAARAAAERMAETLGETTGETVGYLTRLDSKRTARTRILVMTEAIFVATILADPELAGVSAVLFDEAHERHLDSDLGLALALESRSVLRPDLRLAVMSATIDGTRFSSLLGNSPVIESAGKAHPLRIEWLGARLESRIDEAMAGAIAQAWRDETGDILAFLPGVREIERTAARLAERLPQALVLPLHGQVDPAVQRSAIRRGDRRRIVLATAIAETSLTLDGVSVVVDAGLTRRAEFDIAAGVSRLVTHRASQASAGQRAGRAARQGPGVAYRLWEQAAHAGRAAFDPPEILTADLAPLALTLAQWGATDPAALAWLDPPPPPAFAAAQERLHALNAVDAAGRITPHGRGLARLPMEPALAHMLSWAAERWAEREAAEIALLLQERGLGGGGEDIEARLARWRGDRSPRSRASRDLAARWAGLARGLRQAQPQRAMVSGNDHARPVLGEGHAPPPPGILLATAFPANLARRRSRSGEDWLSAGGRGFRLDPISPLAGAAWLAIGAAQGEAKGARIMGAIALDLAAIERWLPERIAPRQRLGWNEAEGRVEARLERRLGAIVLASTPDPAPDAQAVTALLLERARGRIADLVAPALIARGRHAGIAALDPEHLAESAHEWLAPLLEGRRDLALERGAVARAVLDHLAWDQRQALDRLAPREFVSPAATAHPIDYAAPAGPTVELRVQALFGLDLHPTFGEPPQPLLLSLTSPAGRPLATTADLPAFWRGAWRDVVKEMKGRYPRHRWPGEPWRELPSLKTKNAFQRTQT
jgi:ATP-dependent helicase HrpB